MAEKCSVQNIYIDISVPLSDKLIAFLKSEIFSSGLKSLAELDLSLEGVMFEVKEINKVLLLTSQIVTFGSEEGLIKTSKSIEHVGSEIFLSNAIARDQVV